MRKITNPIIPGFNPDPSVCRVGDDYYIATSTFEWFPGIPIYHSKDLVNWRLLTHGLKTTELLDMRGIENSRGVYAPNLTYADNKFWLVFSIVHDCSDNWLSTPCFLTTADSIEGPWSAPVFVSGHGFDPAIFHDDDGRKYILNMEWDGRHNKEKFSGIVLQEYDTEKQCPTGPVHKIFKGSELHVTEGPQILKKDGYYYLVTAEGGTEWRHAVTVCRSKDLLGPYELHPQNPILTSKFREELPLQRAGHGFFVETSSNEWYLTHLCSRPIKDPEVHSFEPMIKCYYSILGRESAIQKVVWRDDGWPELISGNSDPQLEVPAPDLPEHPWPAEPNRDDFDGPELNKHFQTLREPATESWCSLTARPGYLRLIGGDYLHSRYRQSLVARRIQAFKMSTETCMEFEPDCIQQMAGMVLYYDNENHYFLCVSVNDEGTRTMRMTQIVDGNYAEYGDPVELPAKGKIYIRVHMNVQWYQFVYSLDGENWDTVGWHLNSTVLSDEFGDSVFRFTGSFVGLFACDLLRTGKAADFEYFDYQEIHD